MSYGQQPDEWLVAKCREAADEEALAELVRRYSGPVFRLAVSVLGQAFVADAEDVAQDVLVKVRGFPARDGTMTILLATRDGADTMAA